MGVGDLEDDELAIDDSMFDNSLLKTMKTLPIVIMIIPRTRVSRISKAISLSRCQLAHVHVGRSWQVLLSDDLGFGCQSNDCKKCFSRRPELNCPLSVFKVCKTPSIAVKTPF